MQNIEYMVDTLTMLAVALTSIMLLAFFRAWKNKVENKLCTLIHKLFYLWPILTCIRVDVEFIGTDSSETPQVNTLRLARFAVHPRAHNDGGGNYHLKYNDLSIQMLWYYAVPSYWELSNNKCHDPPSVRMEKDQGYCDDGCCCENSAWFHDDPRST